MRPVEGLEIREISEEKSHVLKPLYLEAGWLDDDKILRSLVRGSLLVVGAFSGDLLVGMGRVISDGFSDAYIQDVFVTESARQRGVGTAIVKYLRDACLAKGIGWIGVVAKPGTKGFYERLSFKRMVGHVPMLLRPS